MADLPRAGREADDVSTTADSGIGLEDQMAKLDVSDATNAVSNATAPRGGGGAGGKKPTKKERKQAWKAQRKAKRQKYANVRDHFNETYGQDVDKLEAMQRLCVDFGIPPKAIAKECRKVNTLRSSSPKAVALSLPGIRSS